MSLYQVQKCLFDFLRAKGRAPPDNKPEVSVKGYELTEEERKAVETPDVSKLYAMSTHPVIINSFSRSMGYRRADYRPLLAGSAAAKPDLT
jgi:hypothetical protein